MSVSAVVLPVPILPESDGDEVAVASTTPGKSGLRTAVARSLRTLPHTGTVIVLSAGTEPLVQDVAVLALDRSIPVVADPDLVARIVARGQVPRVQASALAGPAARLAAAVHAVRPGLRVVGVTVPAGADPAAFEGATTALDGALGAAEQVVLAVDGDLGAFDGPPDDRRIATSDAAFERVVLGALRAMDVAGLEALGVARPERVRGLAPLRLALGILRDRGGRFQIHASEVVAGRLLLVGSGR